MVSGLRYHPIRLIAVVCSLALLSACGSSSRSDEASDPPSSSSARGDYDRDGASMAADTAGAETAPETAPEADAKRDFRGRPIVSSVTIVLIPNVGYEINGTLTDLEGVSDFLHVVAEQNRYTDVLIVTDSQGDAMRLAPVLALTEQHRLENVRLSKN